MPNNIAVSITADVADLQVKRAILSAELKTAQKDLNDFARTARSAGATDELRTKMLAAADSAARLRNQVGLIDREVKSLGAGAAEAGALASGAGAAEKAMGGLHVGTAGVTRELIVMGRELSRLNFSRMAGSATILAQRLGVLTPEVLLAGVAIAALVAPVVAVVAAVDSAHADLARFQNDIQLTGNYADLTAGEFEAMARRVAAASNTGLGSARAALAALVASGRFTGPEIEEIGRDAEKMSQMTGKAAKQVLADFIRMADGPTRYAEEFSRQYHGSISLAQLEHIKNLEDEGRKSEATAALVQDLTGWLDRQTVHMGGLAGAWHGLATAIDDAWESWKRFNAGPTQGEELAQKQAQLKSLQTTGTVGGDHFYGAERAQMIATLEKEIAALQARAAADRQSADEAARSARITQAGTDALEKSHATLLSLKSSAEQAHEAVRALHREMAARLRANPNDAEANDYMANHARYDAALMHRMDPGDFKKPDKGPGVVEQWQEEFRAAQVKSNDFFGDEAKAELKFWSDKVQHTTEGSKEWLAVQGHVYEASKALERQKYQEKLATLNDQLQADRDNWAAEQKDWKDKLAFIASKYTEQSSEYKNAHREFEAAEREHQRQMAEIARAGAQDHFNALKSQIEANRSIREADAGTAVSGIQENARYSPILGEVQAAQQIAAIREQLVAKEIADQEQLRAADMQRHDQLIAAAANDAVAYAKAVQAKEAADDEWAQKLRALSDKATNQQVADQQRIAQAWHSAIDPLVSSIGGQFKGLIEGTESWGQAITRIGDGALGMVIQAAERMVQAWIVGELQRTAATQAGAAARTAAGAAEQAPFLARVAAELAHWLGLETAKTASTAAGAAARSTAAGASAGAAIAASKLQAVAEIPAFTAIAAMEAASSVAAVPFAGPALAAAAAGEMVVLGGSMMSLAAFAQGTNVVPADMIAQIHAGERIIPAADNRALMAAVGAGPGGGKSGGKGGDTHNHITYAPTVVPPKGDFRQDLQNHASDLLALIRTAFRNGSLSFP